MAVWLLSGCASGYLLDNNVQSFSQLTGTAGATHLPLRTAAFAAGPLARRSWKRWRTRRLHKAGLRRDDANPRYSVQVGAQLQRVLSPWADPWDGWGWGSAWAIGGVWASASASPFGYGDMEPPWYQREVAVIMRELPSNRVVYETRAFNDGPWLRRWLGLPGDVPGSLAGLPEPAARARGGSNIQVAR